MRKFLVRNFELSTHITLFGKTFVTLRAPRILFPLFCICGCIIIGDPATFTFYWYHAICYAALLAGIWFGFLHYRFFPYRWRDLDYEQKYFYMLFYKKVKGYTKIIFPWGDDPIKFKTNFDLLETGMKFNHQNRRFVNLKSLLGLAIGLASIAIWYFTV